MRQNGAMDRIVTRAHCRSLALFAAVIAMSTSALSVMPEPAHAATTCFGRAPTHTVSQESATYHGGNGDVVIVVTASFTTVFGGRGNDRICVIHGSGGIIHGGPGNDRIRGRAVAEGEGGNDIIRSVDVSYLGAPRGIHADLAAGRATGWGRDRLIGVHDISGSKHDDVIKGSADADDLSGGPGNDLLLGRGGADTLRDENGKDVAKGGRGKDLLFDGPGNDRLNGGGGEDTIDVYDAQTIGAVVNLATHRVKSPDLGTDKLAPNIEDVLGSFFDDTITGNSNDNVIQADHGDDTVYGGGGDDTIDGSDGDDTLYGGGGDDTVQGSYGADTLYGNGGDDTLYGAGFIEGTDISGSDPDNAIIYGQSGDDAMFGGAGPADYLNGGSGIDSADGKDGGSDDCLAETVANCELA
jgi:Ca2+-binding RTX toxin-like protein